MFLKVGGFFATFSQLLAPLVENEAKTHPMHTPCTKLADTKWKRSKITLKTDFAEQDWFSIGVPAVNACTWVSPLSLSLFLQRLYFFLFLQRQQEGVFLKKFQRKFQQEKKKRRICVQVKLIQVRKSCFVGAYNQIDTRRRAPFS